MLNYWWVTRPKRVLNPVPEILAVVAQEALDTQWHAQRGTHLSLEEALETSGLKAVGERRDKTGGGARTYIAWLKSLGLLFEHPGTRETKLTLAGEAILSGEPPVDILKNQVLKYQFPSSYSISRGVNVSPRFKIRPFRFLLRLLSDSRINYLTTDEIAKIIIVEAEKETDLCFEYIVHRIVQYRNEGDSCLDADFFNKYSSNRVRGINWDCPFQHLEDIANTIINWIEYTQLVKRDDEKKVRILSEKRIEVGQILSERSPFIARPENEDVFQRHYGLDPKHQKDSRNLSKSSNVTLQNIAEGMVKRCFLSESLKNPITHITSDLIDSIASETGCERNFVEEILLRSYPHGAIGAFMAQYFEMAFKGRDEATEFEKATVQLFQEALGFKAEHIGFQPRHPDVYILSHPARYIAIIDNKAYHSYTISNDHYNRMVHNYIEMYKKQQQYPLAFFSYIAGGFGVNIDSQIRRIAEETSVHGSAMSVSNMIRLVENYEKMEYDHRMLKRLFSLDRQIRLQDF